MQILLVALLIAAMAATAYVLVRGVLVREVLLVRGVLAAAGERAALPTLDRVYVNPAPAAVADFTLTDQSGKPRSFSSLKGEPALVFFGFTHCPNVCPTALGRLKLLHEARGGALKDARIVLISVDGERDTPEVLKEFLKRFDKDFVGLTAPSAEVRELAMKFSAPFFKDPPKNGAYSCNHFPGAERFGQVVVCAHLQADDAIGFSGFGGKHENRQFSGFGPVPQNFTDLHAGEPRQH